MYIFFIIKIMCPCASLRAYLELWCHREHEPRFACTSYLCCLCLKFLPFSAVRQREELAQVLTSLLQTEVSPPPLLLEGYAASPYDTPVQVQVAYWDMGMLRRNNTHTRAHHSIRMHCTRTWCRWHIKHEPLAVPFVLLMKSPL